MIFDEIKCTIKMELLQRKLAFGNLDESRAMLSRDGILPGFKVSSIHGEPFLRSQVGPVPTGHGRWLIAAAGEAWGASGINRLGNGR